MRQTILSILICLAGASSNALAAPVLVAAAASLNDVLPEILKAWKSDEAKNVTFSFDGSPRLARQIESGLAADLFISADTEWPDFLIAHGKAESGTRQDILGNQLVLIAPAKSDLQPQPAKKFDFTKHARIGLAVETVPAGKYATAVLQQLRIFTKVKDKIVYGDNVRSVLNWIIAGEVPIGFVYKTDAKVAGDKVKVLVDDFEGMHPEIIYGAVVLQKAKNAPAAQKFLDFFRTPEAQKIFAAAGFRVRSK